ncbi:hypothetical protein BJV77DRAFT_960186 [Russula vinacea]|nr:hypothetical protein BJV77DRAFT_960186 [Russula vinacea]
MSDSPDDIYDKLPDELEEGAQLAGNSDTGAASAPAKRGRGRPKGSKNKKSAAGTAASTSEVAPAAGEKRKRGRPPKPKNVPEEGASGEPPRSAREEGHQKTPSLALPTTTLEREARLTLQPSESGAGPRRTPPE